MCTYMAILIFFTLTATGKGGARRYRFSKRQIIDKFRYGLVDNVTNFSLHFFLNFRLMIFVHVVFVLSGLRIYSKPSLHVLRGE